MRSIQFRCHKWFSLALLISSILLISGCDNSSSTTEDGTANLGTPGCPLCGLWETSNGSVRVNSQLTLHPDKFELESRSISGLDCKLTSKAWNPEGDHEGVLVLKGISVGCENKDMQQIDKHLISYHLGKYTLVLNNNNKEELFIRSNTIIPVQRNPLIGKWGVLKTAENAQDYKGKWDKILYRIWFKEHSFKIDYKSTLLDRYIVEDHRVYVIFKTGRWIIVYPV